MTSFLTKAYDRIVLGYPIITLIVVFLIVFSFVRHASDFRLDASADTLVLENDQSLKYYRSVKAIYGSDDGLIVTYTPNEGLEMFSDEVLNDLKSLRDKLKKIERVDSVTSLLDVPLIKSPPITLSELAEEILTLESPKADRALAKKEFLESPLYKELIISADGKTTAMQILFKFDDKWKSLLEQRDTLFAKRMESDLSSEETESLQNTIKQFDDYNASLQEQSAKDIKQVRSIMDEHRDSASLFLGGVPMISSDSVDFVRHDLVTFGVGILVFLIIILSIIFGRARWVVLSMLTCVTAGVTMVGILGMLNWPVTVVSSNFVSLLLILTLSLMVHLIVRYRELLRENASLSQRELILETIKSKANPCLYTSLTTMVAFGSLLVSGIRPVIDFGWMMVIGIVVAQIIAFTLFPAALVLFDREKLASDNDFTAGITQFFAKNNEKNGGLILFLYLVLAIVSVWGITKLTVENRFIDYYKDSTEIYQGMELIDKRLGGTTPLDIILDAPKSFFEEEIEEADPEFADEENDDLFSDEDEEFDDEFADEFDQEVGSDVGITGSSYWFKSYMLSDIAKIHDYLDSLRETGKVLSLTTTFRMLESLDENILANDFELAILYKQLPEVIKKQLIDPYMSEDGNQLRFGIRVFETDASLKREELLTKIRHDLKNDLGLENDQIKITGMIVLYNNMLQSLFTSQILTIGVVFIAIMIMFAVLFRNFKVAILAIIPNMISAGMVLGLMGWLKIPLDMMTITIAAICIGIAVHDTIHYVYRFMEEYEKNPDYLNAAKQSHSTIGRAMYYTSITITLGFSILAFSNFIPTIYFGLLTGFSMLCALLANMTLLSVLIVRFKPLGSR
ncbi:MAG: RND family transporter [Gammaproteobacteria bacterium]